MEEPCDYYKASEEAIRQYERDDLLAFVHEEIDKLNNKLSDCEDCDDDWFNIVSIKYGLEVVCNYLISKKGGKL